MNDLEVDDDLREELAADPELLLEYDKTRLRRRAREIDTEIEARKRPPKDFVDGLLADFETTDEAWRIEGLFPQRSRLLFVAQKKVGKTSMALSATKALVGGGLINDFNDRPEFLGRYAVTPIDGNVGFLNFEVDANMFTGWARAVGIDERRVYVNHLRGVGNPFTNGRDRERLGARLVDHDVKLLIVDPIARAFAGDNIGNTSQMTKFTDQLDQFADDYKIPELILTNHTGWDKERGRDSSVLEDWADTIINVVKDNGKRYLSAIGRSVDIPAEELDYDLETRTFRLTGTPRPQRKTSREDTKQKRVERLVAAVPEILADSGPMNITEIGAALKGRDVPFCRGEIGEACERALNVQPVPTTRKNERRYAYRNDSASARWDDDKNQ
jgi:hypothetical protein